MSLDSNAVQPLKKKKLSDSVCEELERLIISKTLKEGDYFPSERELMAMFQVGRPSVREALQKLSQKGLAEINSGEKTKVTKPSIDAIVGHMSGVAISLLAHEKERGQFEKIRNLFEVAIVREAVLTVTDADFKNFRMILADTKNEIENPTLFAKNDVRFHVAIIDCLNNPMIANIYCVFIDWLIKARQQVSTPELRQQSYEHHCSIVDALEQRNADLAEQHMREHLRYVTESA